MTISYETLMSSIGTLAAAEKITKAKLRELSRDILSYVVETEDIRPVNALLGKDEGGDFILTPINWRISVQYFHHFIAFTSNYEDEVKEYAVMGTGTRTALVFKAKSKKRWDKCATLIEEWLSDEGNDVWSWSNNAKMDAGPKDWRKEIQKVVLNAIGEGKGKNQGDLTLSDVLSAITELDEVSIYDLMGAMEGMGVPHADDDEPLADAA